MTKMGRRVKFRKKEFLLYASAWDTLGSTHAQENIQAQVEAEKPQPNPSR